MILWYAALAALVAWAVFRDPRLDFRWLTAGVLAPDVADAAFGRPAVAHTLVAAAAVLVGVLVATIGRRKARAPYVMLPVGMLLHVVLHGTAPDVFLWPALGARFPERPLLPPLTGIVWRECVGLIGLWWFAHRFGLRDPARLRTLVRRGRVTGE